MSITAGSADMRFAALAVERAYDAVALRLGADHPVAVMLLDVAKDAASLVVDSEQEKRRR